MTSKRQRRQKPLPLFWCRPWKCHTAPTACALRFKKAKRPRGHGEARSLLHCEGCEVGKAHAKRKLPAAWPDGAPIVRSARTPDLVPAASLLKDRRKRPLPPVNPEVE